MSRFDRPVSTPPASREAGEGDPLARVLAWGLALVLVAAPLPFGAVGPTARAALEGTAFALGGIWLARGLVRPSILPPTAVWVGLAGLLGLAVLQGIPAGHAVVSLVSPGATEARDACVPPPALETAEREMIGVEPASLDRAPALSLDPPATASALRTGIALALLLLTGTAVAGAGMARIPATALVLSSSFQSLYGLAVLATGHDRIWTVEKIHYLDSATGTFVNRNHFAGFVAAGVCVGIGSVFAGLRSRTRLASRSRGGAAWIEGAGAATILIAAATLLGLAGLLLSHSRAGIACGIAAAALLPWTAGADSLRRRTRAGLAALFVVAGAIPIATLGPERLIERYSRTADDFLAEAGRGVVWLDTLEMARSFPVTGVGFGAFAAAYPGFRSPGVRARYSHAHNDVLQLAAEGGGVGLAALLAILVPLAASVFAAVLGRRGPLQAGVAAGLAVLVVHSLVEFHFHIPANAATAAILAGALLANRWNDRD